MKVVLKNSTLQFQSKMYTPISSESVAFLYVKMDDTPVKIYTSTAGSRKIYYISAEEGLTYRVQLHTNILKVDDNNDNRYGCFFCQDFPANGVTGSNSTIATNDGDGHRTIDALITAPANGYICVCVFNYESLDTLSFDRKNF